MTTPKHPDQIAWEKWRDSQIGKAASSPFSGLGKRQNEIVLMCIRESFMAGVKHGEGKK